MADTARSSLKSILLGPFAGMSRALASRNYRLYAMGHVAHVHGWWGNRLGIGWLTWQLTESPAWLGIITFAAMLPVMLVAPLAGAVADKYGHRRTAVTAGLIGTVITLAMVALAFAGVITLQQLLVLTVLQGLVFGLEFPARQALIPQLVGQVNISAAVAFNSTTFQLGAFLGPVLAAALITSFQPAASILLYAVTTLWMAAMILRIDLPAPKRAKGEGGSVIGNMGAGFKYAWDTRALTLLFTVTFTAGFLMRPYIDLLPGFAGEVYNQGAAGLGALTAASGLGALLTAIWLLMRSRTQGLVSIMTASAVLTAAALIIFANMSNVSYELRWALPVLAVAAGALLANQVSAYSLVQTLARPDMRGRVIGINISINMGAPATGALVLGWLAAHIGLPEAVMAASALAAVLYILLIPALRRRRDDLERVAEESGGN